MQFTQDFKDAANALVRCPKARVAITWTSKEIDSEITASSNDSNVGSQLDQVSDSVVDMSRKWAYANPKTLADGTFIPMPVSPDEGQIGWFGYNKECDAAGVFSWDPVPPELYVSFDARIVTEVNVSGDTVRGEYPAEFDITIRTDALGFATSYFPNNTKVSGAFPVFVPDEMQGNVTSIELRVYKWSVGNDIVKISEFYAPFKEIYKGDDVSSLTILEESNSDSGSIPIGNISSNELDLSLMNINRRFTFGNPSSPYVNLLRPNRIADVWLGFVLPPGTADASDDVPGYIVEDEQGDKVGYMPYGVYYTRDWVSSYTSMEASVSAFDAMEWLRNTEFNSSLVYTATAYDLAVAIMESARDKLPFLRWEIDTSLQSINFVKAWLPIMSYFDALKKLSEATSSFTYTTREGIIYIGSPLVTTVPPVGDASYVLDESTYYSYQSQPKTDEISNRVRVSFTELEDGAATEDIYSSTEGFVIPPGETETEIFIEWSPNPVDVDTISLTFTPSTGSPVLGGVRKYANGAVITVTGTAGDEFTFSATGTPYTELDKSFAVVTDEESVSRYGLKEFEVKDNTLIQSYVQAAAIAETVRASYGDLRRDGSANWSGNVIASVGDTMQVTEFKDDSNDIKDYFLIQRQNIVFDGSLRVTTSLRRGI